MPVSFCTNTTSGACRNAGGMRNMDTALPETSACTLTLKNAVLSVPITTEVFASSVSQFTYFSI